MGAEVGIGEEENGATLGHQGEYTSYKSYWTYTS